MIRPFDAIRASSPAMPDDDLLQRLRRFHEDAGVAGHAGTGPHARYDEPDASGSVSS